MLNIVTVASGGGSVLWFDGQKMRVGPESAGAYPDPACYGFGGPLTITDANLLTGRIMPEYFPKTFGSDQNSPLNGDVIQKKFFSLTKDVNTSSREKFTPQEVALGFLRIANEKMAMAIKEISVSKALMFETMPLSALVGPEGNMPVRQPLYLK